MSASTTAHRSSDLGAALTGLIVGAVALFIIVFTIVKLTNASFAGEHETAAPATTAAPAAPATTAAPAAPAAPATTAAPAAPATTTTSGSPAPTPATAPAGH